MGHDATPDTSGPGVPDESETAARRVLDEASRVAHRLLGRRFEAAFVLGSLAHGGYAPRVSDVDLALVVRDAGPLTQVRVRAVRPVTRWRAGAGPADRLSVFWGRWRDVHRGAVGPVRLPEIDRLDLLEHGWLRRGRDRRAGAVPPSHEALVLDAAGFAQRWYDPQRIATLREPAALLPSGARPVTKAVLFPVRFLATLHTGHVGAQAVAIEWYARIHGGAHTPLVRAAERWRIEGLEPDSAATSAVLAAHLVPLHREVLAAYRSWLAARGHAGLASRFADVEDALD